MNQTTYNGFTPIEPDDYYILPEDKGDKLYHYLNSAQKNIDLVIYSLSSTDIQECLLAAKKRGVNITILHNSNLSHPLTEWKKNRTYWHLFQTIENLNSAEGSGTLDVRWSSNNFFITHQKTFLIDTRPIDTKGTLAPNARVVIMTHNLHAEKSLGFKVDTKFWWGFNGTFFRDMAYIFKSPEIINEVLKVYLSDFNGDGPSVTNDLLNSRQLFWSNGSFFDDSKDYPDINGPYIKKDFKKISIQGNTDTISNMVSWAKQTIDIYFEAFADCNNIVELLDEAKKNQVKIRIIVCQSLLEISESCRKLVGELTSIGIAIKVFTSSIDLHAKAIIIDAASPNAVMYSGSQNHTYMSLYCNRECGVLLKGKVVKRVSETFDSDWNSPHTSIYKPKKDPTANGISHDHFSSHDLSAVYSMDHSLKTKSEISRFYVNLPRGIPHGPVVVPSDFKAFLEDYLKHNPQK